MDRTSSPIRRRVIRGNHVRMTPSSAFLPTDSSIRRWLGSRMVVRCTGGSATYPISLWAARPAKRDAVLNLCFRRLSGAT
jgi:hypothetical protein